MSKGLDEATGKPGNFIHVSIDDLAEAVREIKRLRSKMEKYTP
jgi:hypothetical protein